MNEAYLILLLIASACGVVRGCIPASVQDIEDATIIACEVSYGNPKEGDVVGKGYTILKVIKETFDGDSFVAIIAKKSLPPTTMISYRGTTTANQLVNQFKSGVAGIDKTKLLEYTVGGSTVKVMEYTWKAMLKLNVQDSLDINPEMKYIITGHSLGGALATLFSLYMVDKSNGALWKNPGSVLITLASPRVGDKSFSKTHDELIPAYRKLRIIYHRDMVPHLPYMSTGYHHTAREIWIHKKWEQYWVKRWWGHLPQWRTVNFWNVCPTTWQGEVDADGYDCSNGLGWYKVLGGWLPRPESFSVLDHRGTGYVDAVKELVADSEKSEAFITSQCN